MIFCNHDFQAPSTKCKDQIQQINERRKMIMDYVSNGNVVIAKEGRSDKAGRVLAYDMYLAKNRKSKVRKEKEKHA